MLVPKVTFNESNVGTSPIRAGIRNRIGIVGKFSRGPANIFSYINGYTDFAARYGSDLSEGSIAFQAAYDQGARDFGLVRILGNAKAAQGELIFSGIASKPNTILLHIKYIGEAVPLLGSITSGEVFTSGVYTGTAIGRYHFKVITVSSGVASIKYKFVPITEASIPERAVIDWTAVTDVLTVDLTSDKGVDKTASGLNGLALQFGTATQTENIELYTNQEFTVRVNSYLFNIPIFKDATTSQVVSAIISNIQGDLPIGQVSSNINNNGVIFGLDSSLAGNLSNGYSYYLDLEEPDGLVLTSAVYHEDANDTNPRLVITGVNGSYIESDAIISSDDISIPNGTQISDVDKVTNAGVTTTTLTLNNPLNATDGNTYEFRFAHASGLTLAPYTSSEVEGMTGGEDGPRNSHKDFYSLNGTPILRILATSPGAWGNNLKVTLYPITNSTFRLTVEDEASSNYNPMIEPEAYLIDLINTDAIDNIGEINILKNSNLIRGIFLPKNLNPGSYDVGTLRQSPQRIEPKDDTITDETDPRHSAYYGPSKLRAIFLEGGHDGPEITDADYVEALNQLREAPVHIVLAPGIYDRDTVKAHLIAISENSSELEGLKIAILNARPNLTPYMAQREALGLDSKRAVMVAGWSTYAGQPNAPRFGLSPDALYAGKLAAIPFYVGPNARTSAGAVIGISEIDIQKYNSLSSLQVYTDARLEILTLDPTQGGFFLINGRTLSTSTSWDKVVIRRTYDIIRQDLYRNLQQYKSEPHTRLLRSQIATSINAYMSGLARNGRIANFSPAICDDSNNPPENYTTGELNVAISFLPLYAADYISVTFIRNTSGGLQIGE